MKPATAVETALQFVKGHNSTKRSVRLLIADCWLIPPPAKATAPKRNVVFLLAYDLGRSDITACIRVASSPPHRIIGLCSLAPSAMGQPSLKLSGKHPGTCNVFLDNLRLRHGDSHTTPIWTKGEATRFKQIADDVALRNAQVRAVPASSVLPSDDDLMPTFFKDPQGHLYVLTHCGGGDNTRPFYSFRISHLDPALGWAPPKTLMQTEQKGEVQQPSIAFAPDARSFWFIWKSDVTRHYSKAVQVATGEVHVRRGRPEMERFSAPIFRAQTQLLDLVPTVVTEHHPVKDFRSLISGRLRQPRPTMTYRGETYTLLRGNLHEHTENSNCWPAGCDGTLHEEIRYGLYSEGYDFAGITDHTYSMTEGYWRKTLRMAEFYNDPEYFVGLPSQEWTLSNNGNPVIGHGVGHRNLFFADVNEALKFIRNQDEVYSEKDPETRISPKLWVFIHKHKIDCVAIPHHPADAVHAMDWEVHDGDIEPVVELFQCRGNAEYRGAPRMITVSRHHPMAHNDKGFVK